MSARGRFLVAFASLALLGAGAIRAEDSLVITVVPFTTQAEPDFAFLGESFSETLSTKLVGVHGIKLYERSQFARVAEELKLESSQGEFFDQETVARVGKVVSIDYMLLGSVALAGGRLTCNVRLVNVDTGRAALAKDFRGAYPKELFDMQDKVALAVADTLQIKLSELDRRSLERKPTADMDAFSLYNSSLSARNDRQKITLLEKAAERDPGFTQALNLLADLYEDAGRSADARAAYAKILAADPEDYRASYNLALLDFDAGERDKASELLLSCVAMKGEDPDALYHLGLIREYGSSGKRFDPGADLPAARGYYERARAADPKHRESLLALGVLCASLAQSSSDPAEQLGLVDESCGSLEAYLAACPDAPNRGEIEANLDLLVDAEKKLKEYLGKP